MNGRYRRNLAVAVPFGEGPFTIRFADLRHRAMQNRWFGELAIHALASRLRASWMEARATKAPRVAARFSKSLARRRLRPNQEKVRSTTQRRGKTTKALHVVAPLDDLHAQRRHLCHRSVNLPGVVAAIGPDQFEPREAPAYLVEDEPGPVAVLDR